MPRDVGVLLKICKKYSKLKEILTLLFYEGSTPTNKHFRVSRQFYVFTFYIHDASQIHSYGPENKKPKIVSDFSYEVVSKLLRHKIQQGK